MTELRRPSEYSDAGTPKWNVYPPVWAYTGPVGYSRRVVVGPLKAEEGLSPDEARNLAAALEAAAHYAETGQVTR